jgi:hypothetical protein
MPLLATRVLAELLTPGAGQGAAVRGSLAAEIGELREDQLRDHALRMARTKWLEDHDVEASFPCGVVRYEGGAPAEGEQQAERDPWARAERLGKADLPVFAAVLPDEVAFLAEPPEETGLLGVLELGSIARTAIGEVRVVDEAGADVAEVAAETIEPSVHREVVLTWSRDGQPDEDRFRFRSTWLASEAARRLRSAATLAARTDL